MELAVDYKELIERSTKHRIVTIGNFDGVHLGHQAVLQHARREAESKGLELAVLTFEPHPAEFLKPEGTKLRLSEPKRKAELLSESGADLILAQRFDEQFSKLSAEDFATDVLVRALKAKKVIVGANFRFGKGRQGGVATLTRLGEKLGFEVRGKQLIRSENDEVSSSRIRQLILKGEVALSGELLGRCYEIPGTVSPGKHHGKILGFPTLNLEDIHVLLPAPGIYAARCVIGNQEKEAAVYIGNRPTMGFGFSVEAHLIDFSGNLYGQRVVLKLVARIRGDKKFPNSTALKEQMTLDVERTREILASNP